MQVKVIISESARNDIKSTLLWTLHTFGELQHHAYSTRIENAIAELRRDPYVGSVREKFHPTLRFHRISKIGRRARHVLVYAIREDKTVEISRMLYDGMDLKKHLAAYGGYAGEG